MAKPLSKIAKTQFIKEYNITEVLIDRISIMNKLKTFNPNNQAVAFGVRKKPRDTTPIWFKEFEAKTNATLTNIIVEMRNGFKQINSRIDNLVTVNNLKE
ncbi:MAG: hypothetical protein MJ200_04845 [Mycoplasmoidaceae bacterium]|nr:hypothetical protein [Mycoplasmoidaceae bacterium]